MQRLPRRVVPQENAVYRIPFGAEPPQGTTFRVANYKVPDEYDNAGYVVLEDMGINYGTVWLQRDRITDEYLDAVAAYRFQREEVEGERLRQAELNRLRNEEARIRPRQVEQERQRQREAELRVFMQQEQERLRRERERQEQQRRNQEHREQERRNQERLRQEQQRRNQERENAELAALIAAQQEEENAALAALVATEEEEEPAIAAIAAEEEVVGGPKIGEFFDFNRLITNSPGTFYPSGRAHPIPGYRYGMCPICLNIFEESGEGGDCLYHVHTCPLDLRNDRLWNKYKYRAAGGNVGEFCQTCGRACEGHGHFILTEDNIKPPRAPPAPALIPGVIGSFWDCTGSGGGGRRELVARVLGIIRFLNNYNQIIRQDKNFITLCSEAGEAAAMNGELLRLADRCIQQNRFLEVIHPELRFDAAIRPLPRRNNIQRNGQIQNAIVGNPGEIANQIFAFLMPQAQWRPIMDRGVELARGLGGIVRDGFRFMCARRQARPAGQAACPEGHHKPEALQVAGLRCYLCLLEGEEDDGRVVYRFHHDNFEGRNYVHTDQQLICKEHLESYITSRVDAELNNIDSRNPKCFTSQAEGCGGIIHPCEIEGILEQALVNRYKEGIYEPWARQQGGARRNKKRKTRKNKKMQRRKTKTRISRRK